MFSGGRERVHLEQMGQWKVSSNDLKALFLNLSRPDPWRKKNINLNLFHTSLQCLKRLYTLTAVANTTKILFGPLLLGKSSSLEMFLKNDSGKFRRTLRNTNDTDLFWDKSFKLNGLCNCNCSFPRNFVFSILSVKFLIGVIWMSFYWKST